MNELQIFNNSEFGEIRTIEINGEPWFVASDICNALELSNTTSAVGRLDDDEKSKFNLGLSGGETNCVNEYGLYNLVLASRKENAKRFKRWITHEVIPTIRRTGGYRVPQTPLEALQMTVEQIVEQEKRLNSFENRLDIIEAKSQTVPNEYFTVAGFATIRKQKIDVVTANMLGRKAAKMSREYGYDIGKVSDPRYGTVNTYHVDILNKIM